MFLTEQRAGRRALLVSLIVWAFGLAITNAQSFDLSDATQLVAVNVKAVAAEYKGRKAVLITRDAPKRGEAFKGGFALLKGVDFQDGTIEGEIALKVTAPRGNGENARLCRRRIPSAARRLILRPLIPAAREFELR